MLYPLPTHVILCKPEWAKVANYMLVGVIAASLPFVGIVLIDGSSSISVNNFVGYPIMAITCAAAVSWTFGTIALKSSDLHDADEPGPKKL